MEDAEGNEKFKKLEYIEYHKKCSKKYNFKNIELSLKNCENIIKGNKRDYKKDYIVLDSF